MPAAPLRFCATPKCSILVTRGHCPTHQKVQNKRTSATQRGYTSQWERFRLTYYPQMLIDAGKVPACGASLAGRHAAYSQCVRDGVVTMSSLELDHEPPLTQDERAWPEVVCDAHRVGFLCRSCHTAKTNRERVANV
jgi:hypothetical protein